MDKVSHDPVRQARKEQEAAKQIRMTIVVSLAAAGGHRERQGFGSKRKGSCCRKAV